jgi:hypothetical protein
MGYYISYLQNSRQVVDLLGEKHAVLLHHFVYTLISFISPKFEECCLLGCVAV